MPVFGLYGFFAITATFYSMVGFGGGSTYIALLGLFGVHYTLIPVISLLCNICVVTHNIQRYRKEYQVSNSILLPLLLTSIPSAFLGGQYEINESLYLKLLSGVLLLAGATMAWKLSQKDYPKPEKTGLPLLLFIGISLGFVSGLVGIGGGIFLAPILYLLGVAHPKRLTLYTAYFIWFNSISGLVGQLQKGIPLENITPYLPLCGCVLIGSTLGHWLHFKKLSNQQVGWATITLLWLVAVRLFMGS